MILLIHQFGRRSKMKRLVVELDDDLHKKIKLQALNEDKSIKNYVRDVIRKDLQKQKEQTR